MTVHAKETGPRTLYFKRPCSPYELYQRRYYGHNVTQITVEMKKGQTLMFCLADVDPEGGTEGEKP